MSEHGEVLSLEDANKRGTVRDNCRESDLRYTGICRGL